MSPLPDLTTTPIELPARDVQCTEDEARGLVVRIRRHLGDAGALVAEARERQAHLALGYATWTAFVEAEFNITDRQARYLIQQARVSERLTQASGGNAFPLTIVQTTVLARDLEGAAAEVQEMYSTGTTPDAAAVIYAVVAETQPASVCSICDHHVDPTAVAVNGVLRGHALCVLPLSDVRVHGEGTVARGKQKIRAAESHAGAAESIAIAVESLARELEHLDPEACRLAYARIIDPKRGHGKATFRKAGAVLRKVRHEGGA